MSRKTVKQEVKIETTYGTMTFKSWPEAFKFVETIASWTGFTEKTRPTSVEQAVEYHLAYVEGGFPEVRRVMRERREREHIRSEYGSRGRQRDHGGCIGCGGHGGLPRELWGMPPSVIEKEWARRMSMGYYGW